MVGKAGLDRRRLHASCHGTRGSARSSGTGHCASPQGSNGGLVGEPFGEGEGSFAGGARPGNCTSPRGGDGADPHPPRSDLRRRGSTRRKAADRKSLDRAAPRCRSASSRPRAIRARRRRGAGEASPRPMRDRRRARRSRSGVISDGSTSRRSIGQSVSVSKPSMSRSPPGIGAGGVTTTRFSMRMP